jgi:hypothetical protein
MRFATSRLALLAFLAGCVTADAPTLTNFGGCTPSTVIAAGAGITDFEQRNVPLYDPTCITN